MTSAHLQAISMHMRPLLALLLVTVSVAAEPVQRAQLFIERGLMHQQMLHDPAQAAALYRRALTAPDATPRTSAEALWHMAMNYSARGSDRVSLLILTKLQHDCAGVEPFARLAAAESIAISAEDVDITGPREGPNLNDLIAAQDAVRYLEAAVKLNPPPVVATFTRQLRWHCEAMVFDLSMAATTEPAEEKRDREAQLETCREWLEWAKQGAHPALDDPVAAAIKERTILQNDPLLQRIFAARDAMTMAIGNADATAAARALETMRTLTTPITQGPEVLLLVRGFRGELAAMARSIVLLETHHPAAALLAWAEARSSFHESGAGTSGFSLMEMEALPESLLPQIMGDLTHLEYAMTELMNHGEEGIESAQQSLQTAVSGLAATAEKCADAAGKARLGKAIRRLREAIEKLEQGDLEGADSLMHTEMYGSL